MGKSGKRIFRPKIFYEDYPYSVNVTDQTKTTVEHAAHLGNQGNGHFGPLQNCMRITLIPSMLPPR